MTEIARIFKQFALPAAMMASIAVPVSAQEKHGVPALDYLDQHNDTTGIGALRADFAQTHTGRQYLAFADSAGVSIAFNNERCTEFEAEGLYYPQNRGIYLKSTTSRKEQLGALAHELRHSVSDILRGVNKAENSLLAPTKKFALHRFDEADAFAAEIYYLAERGLALGDSAEINTRSFYGPDIRRMQNRMADGVLAQEEYHATFIDMLISVNHGYPHHPETVGDIIERLKPILKQEEPSDLLLDAFHAAASLTPTEAAFEKLLRGFGGNSIDAKVQPLAAGPKTSMKDLVTLYPFIGTDMKGRTTLQADLAAKDKLNSDIIRAVAGTQGIILRSAP